MYGRCSELNIGTRQDHVAVCRFVAGPLPRPARGRTGAKAKNKEKSPLLFKPNQGKKRGKNCGKLPHLHITSILVTPSSGTKYWETHGGPPICADWNVRIPEYNHRPWGPAEEREKKQKNRRGWYSRKRDHSLYHCIKSRPFPHFALPRPNSTSHSYAHSTRRPALSPLCTQHTQSHALSLSLSLKTHRDIHL